MNEIPIKKIKINISKRESAMKSLKYGCKQPKQKKKKQKTKNKRYEPAIFITKLQSENISSILWRSHMWPSGSGPHSKFLKL